MKTISMLELQALTPTLPAKSLILDVRTPEEFQAGHVPGARNIPHTDALQHHTELASYPTVVIYCRAGARAAMAAMDLSQAGLQNLICVNRGGMPDWEAAGFPVER